jgi:hypothetical protein
MRGSIFPEKRIADDYPNLAGVFARPIRLDLIEQQYDEMVKAVALKGDTATAEAILKRYNSYNLTHPAYKALAEVGKAGIEMPIYFEPHTFRPLDMSSFAPSRGWPIKASISMFGGRL